MYERNTGRENNSGRLFDEKMSHEEFLLMFERIKKRSLLSESDLALSGKHPTTGITFSERYKEYEAETACTLNEICLLWPLTEAIANPMALIMQRVVECAEQEDDEREIITQTHGPLRYFLVPMPELSDPLSPAREDDIFTLTDYTVDMLEMGYSWDNFRVGVLDAKGFILASRNIF